MFGIGGTEFVLIALLALILLGPEKLPEYARKAGRLWADFKRYQDSMESMIRAEIRVGQSERRAETSAAPAPLTHGDVYMDDDEDEEEEE